MPTRPGRVPKPTTVRQWQRVLGPLLRRADEARREGTKTLDGHWPAAAAQHQGVRVSVRFNRHDQREVSIAAHDHGVALDPAEVEKISEAHRELTGAALQWRYSEPRFWVNRNSGNLYWVVLRRSEKDEQGRLI